MFRISKQMLSSLCYFFKKNNTYAASAIQSHFPTAHGYYKYIELVYAQQLHRKYNN